MLSIHLRDVPHASYETWPAISYSAATPQIQLCEDQLERYLGEDDLTMTEKAPTKKCSICEKTKTGVKNCPTCGNDFCPDCKSTAVPGVCKKCQA
jgi:hypothetical protein